MGEDIAGKQMYRGGNYLNVWRIINEKNSQTRGKILWHGVANLKIREEEVRDISSFSRTSHRNRWHLIK